MDVLNAKGWVVKALVDDDGHLTVWVSHNDGTDVREIENGDPDGYQIRLTTKGIEDAFQSEFNWTEASDE